MMGGAYLDRVVTLAASDTAHRRAVKAALAVQIYRFDRRGDWPGSLQDLVPEYLAEVPSDPFSSAPTSLQYGVYDPVVPLAPPRWVIFSGTSDGAPATQPFVSANGQPNLGFTQANGQIVVDLTFWRVTESGNPSTQPGEFVAPPASDEALDDLP